MKSSKTEWLVPLFATLSVKLCPKLYFLTIGKYPTRLKFSSSHCKSTYPQLGYAQYQWYLLLIPQSLLLQECVPCSPAKNSTNRVPRRSMSLVVTRMWSRSGDFSVQISLRSWSSALGYPPMIGPRKAVLLARTGN